jgi:hypothetical protein
MKERTKERLKETREEGEKIGTRYQLSIKPELTCFDVRFAQLTREHQDELMGMLKRILRRIGEHEEFKWTVDDFLAIFDYVYDITKKGTEEMKETPQVP